MNESRTLVLCADDFGLDSGVSEGILKLVRLGRLSAVSCMVNAPDFNLHAPELCSLKKKVKLGLHFNLTEGYFLSKPGTHCFTLNELLIKTHLHWIKSSFIAAELRAQFNQFVATMQQLPDFIDGHQHVHQFPQVRQVILDFYLHKWKTKEAAIRSTWPAIHVPRYSFKAHILSHVGGKALQRRLVQLDIPHNCYFSGIYDFAPETNYRDLFREWLRLAKENTLIMCHPGEGLSNKDAISAARLVELTYFLSDEFLKDCAEYKIQLV